MKSLRCLHFGSYWMGKNDIVYAMATDLRRVCKSNVIDVGIYSQNPDCWYVDDFSRSTTYPVRWLNHEKVMQVVRKHNPDFVVCNSGGITFLPDTIRTLKKRNITTIGISLSDPDVFYDQGKHYYHAFDMFYTNSEYAHRFLYEASAHVRLLPFAASAHIHKPLPIRKRYDVVIVGHARKERLEIVHLLQKDFHVGTFGQGWNQGSREVRGEKQVRAINQGKIYLSFPLTIAGFTNVKVGVFEAAACKSCILLPFIPEIEQYFTYGLNIVGYSNEKTLKETIHYYLKHPNLRSWIAENAYARFLSDHTWEQRWRTIIYDLKEHKYGSSR